MTFVIPAEFFFFLNRQIEGKKTVNGADEADEQIFLQFDDF